jgi:frataxin-like iron-binding protein CyaY
MKIVFFFSLLAFLISQGINAQVKLGDNPERIDPASLFELESTEQVLVITRVSSAELQAITPSMGALAYNTDEKCLFYHNGEVWVNLCEALGRSFSTDAIANEFPTIVITPLDETVNFEVGEIRSENIVDFSIGSQDIQNNSINSEKLSDASVGAAELQDNAVTGRNMDFIDITLSDFINDVPFVVQGNLVAAAISYDNTASGLNASDLQQAIDLLSSGLDAVDLQSTGDGTYVFTRGDGTTTGFDLNAAALPFDNTSNGFAATDVQGAIEEIQGGSSDDQTLTLNSPLLEIEGGNSVDLSGFLDNTDGQELTLNGALLAIENGNSVDLSGLTSGVNTDQQQILDFSFEPSTNRLTLEIENATSENVDLSSLVGGDADGSETRIADSPTVTVTGTGTAADPYQLASAGGADGSETIIDNSATVSVAGSGTTADPYILTSSGGTGGADGSETILSSTSTVIVSGTGTLADPYLLESTGGADGSETVIDDSATVTVEGSGTTADPYILTSTGGTGGGNGSETIINSTATVLVSGTGTTTDPYLLESTGGADGSETIIDDSATVTVEGSGTTADPYVLTSAGGADDQTALEVAFSPAGNTESTDVQTAIEELQTDIDGISGNIANPNDELINTFELNGTSLEITEATVPLAPVDLDPVFATDAEVLAAIVVSDASDGDTESDNEIQDLTLDVSTNALSITNNPAAIPVDLSLYLDNTDEQSAAEVPVTFVPLNYLPASPDVEAHLSRLDEALATLGANPTDEIQDLQLISNTLSITNNPSPTDIDLTPYLDNTDDQALSLTGNILTLEDGGTVDLAPYLDNTDDQQITDFSLSGNIITLTLEDGGTQAIDLTPVASGDDQALSLSGNTLALEDGGTVDLTPYIDNTDDQQITDFSLTANVITLTLEDGGTQAIDLSGLISNDDQALSLSGNTLTLEDGGTVDLAPYLNPDQDATQILLSPSLDMDGPGPSGVSTTVQEALEALGGIPPVPPSLPLANAVQSDPLRTYDLNSGNLAFIGSGRIGIGSSLTNPQSKLDVDGQVQSRGGFASTGGTEGNPGYGFYTNGDTNTGMFRAAADQLAFSTGGVEALRINTSQNVGIGTIAPTERLHVDGNILATGTITPDFVFEKYFKGSSALKPEYAFQSLEEIYEFVRANNHLPGVPSASDVALKGGILINRATEINLEKIEELFLHTIEQERKIKTLQTEKDILNSEVSELKLRLERIEKLLLAKSEN